jgi:predicted dehydrogenase
MSTLRDSARLHGSNPARGAARELRVAMLGGGLMAKSHSMAFRNVEAVYGDVPLRPRLHVLCDEREDLAADAATTLGYERWTTDWRAAVADPDVDVVSIVTPNWLHKEMALAALAAGKHVYCEKPLAVTAADAREMAEAAKAAGARTLVGFNYVRNPAVEFARELIAAGELGELQTFRGAFVLDAVADPAVPFTWRFDRRLAGTGALGDLGAHVIALAHALVGPIAAVCGLARTWVAERPTTSGVFGYGSEADKDAPVRAVENDDVMQFLCEFADGPTGAIECSRIATGRRYAIELEVSGSKGALRFNQQDIYKLDVYLSGDPAGRQGFRRIDVGPGHGDFGRFWPIAGVPLGVHELKVIEVHELLQAIAEGRPARPDFEEGRRVCEVIDAVAASAEERRWVEVDHG